MPPALGGVPPGLVTPDIGASLEMPPAAWCRPAYRTRRSPACRPNCSRFRSANPKSSRSLVVLQSRQRRPQRCRRHRRPLLRQCRRRLSIRMPSACARLRARPCRRVLLPHRRRSCPAPSRGRTTARPTPPPPSRRRPGRCRAKASRLSSARSWPDPASRRLKMAAVQRFMGTIGATYNPDYGTDRTKTENIASLRGGGSAVGKESLASDLTTPAGGGRLRRLGDRGAGQQHHHRPDGPRCSGHAGAGAAVRAGLGPPVRHAAHAARPGRRRQLQGHSGTAAYSTGDTKRGGGLCASRTGRSTSRSAVAPAAAPAAATTETPPPDTQAVPATAAPASAASADTTASGAPVVKDASGGYIVKRPEKDPTKEMTDTEQYLTLVTLGDKELSGLTDADIPTPADTSAATRPRPMQASCARRST